MVIILLNIKAYYDNYHSKCWLDLNDGSCYLIVECGIQSICFVDSLEIAFNSLKYSDQVRGTIF